MTFLWRFVMGLVFAVGAVVALDVWAERQRKVSVDWWAEAMKRWHKARKRGL